MHSRKLMATQDVADCLGVSISTVKRLVRAGELRPLTVGARLVRFTPEAVEEYLVYASCQKSA